jgi:Na+/melibiose symporter-like transporter
MFDGAFNTFMFVNFQKFCAKLAEKYGTFYSIELFHEMWLVLTSIAFVFMVIAVISIAPKDNSKYFGTGRAVKVGIKDYWETLKGNRALQMLIVSASSDKLATSAKTSAVTIVMFGIVAGNYSLSGTLSGLTTYPSMILLMLGIGTLATKLGQRKAMLIGSIGGIITNSLLASLWLFGNPTSMNGTDGSLVFSSFTILYLVLTILTSGLQGISGNIVVPMTADCADYEVYRSGKYVPGMMGTLFSFVDKLISSAAPMITGLMFAMIGFKEVLPDVTTPYSTQLHYTGVFLMYGMIILGLLCNIIALRFYPLTKEKMEEIQSEIAAIKAANA